MAKPVRRLRARRKIRVNSDVDEENDGIPGLGCLPAAPAVPTFFQA